MSPSLLRIAPLLAVLAVLACDDDPSPSPTDTGSDPTSDTADALPDTADSADEGTGTGPEDLVFPAEFTFGAASAAHQIEGNNTNNQWYQFETLPEYEGHTEDASGLAANGYELWETDNGLVEATHLASYRFSIEWSRIMPSRGTFDEDEIAHYRAILEDLRDRGIRPFVTLHHFTDPIWVNDLTDLACQGGPQDDNLCGWSSAETVAAFTQFATRMGQEYGDLVDDWSTFNEPNTYTHVGYLAQTFPPGHPGSPAPSIPDDAFWLGEVAPVVRGLIAGHAAAYDALKAADTEDADGDDIDATVGWTIATQYIVPVDPEDDADVFAAERYRAFLNTIFPDAVATGDWDPDFDGTVDETHPEWVGRQDFIGVQYYSRTFVLRSPLEGDILVFVPCQAQFAALFPDCPEIDPLNQSFINEIYPSGLYEVVTQFAERFPDVPLPITENGVAAENGERKAQVLVRHLEQVHRLLEDGYPVTGYWYWSLTDNFEWAAGFSERFGLFRVDYDTFERTPTRAQEVYAGVAETHVLSGSLREELGTGPLLADD